MTIEQIMLLASTCQTPRDWSEFRNHISAFVAQARDEALEHCIDVCNVHASDNGTAQKIANDINGWRIAGRKDASWEHLKQYGYAPGNYMSTCHKCGATPTMDKRAITCRQCAESMHAEWIAGRKE